MNIQTEYHNFYILLLQGGTQNVDTAEYFFEYLFDDGIEPGTVYNITLSTEIEPVDGENEVRSSILVLTCELILL